MEKKTKRKALFISYNMYMFTSKLMGNMFKTLPRNVCNYH